MTIKAILQFHLELLFWILIILAIIIPGSLDCWIK